MMSGGVRIAFEREVVVIPLSDILPLRKLAANVAASKRYQRIATSVLEVGIIEPLVIARQKSGLPYLLMDGHLRYFALLERAETEVRCIVADDDEAFTYNKRVNRLATIQEHYMIVRAIERGVSEEKIARALGVDTKLIQRRKNLLDGICQEVVELLKDRSVNPQTFEVLRKLKPLRQIEAAELMVSAGNFSTSYAKALLAATRQADLMRPDKPKQIIGMTPEQMARMEREMESLNRDFKAVEDTFGDDVLQLVLASRYLSRLVANQQIAAYLGRRHPDMLTEFQTIIAAASLDQAAVA
ncbi:plasmid partitioning protein RepB C-terminal domain-containing protein [Sphingomonas caeni]|uniref:plasmid partitioning protein RepB C-terminal domain-containing protein n=1 Tax=Sphingomonas caeni TaxID=2984949 RepID=UPI00222F146B|nr:plasmid partitioning protein RepB C-terminal domain-containing protein [Sphingomonas caeni]